MRPNRIGDSHGSFEKDSIVSCLDKEHASGYNLALTFLRSIVSLGLSFLYTTKARDTIIGNIIVKEKVSIFSALKTAFMISSQGPLFLMEKLGGACF